MFRLSYLVGIAFCVQFCCVYVYTNNVLLSEKLRNLEQQNCFLAEELSAQREMWNSLKANLNSERKRQIQDCNEGPAVVFSTRLRNTLYPLGKNQIITYDDIVTNVGRGYDSVTGIFEAPLDGLYQVIATIWSTNGYSVDVEIIHNGTDVCYAKTTTTNNTMGICATVLEMKANERVWVRHLGTIGNYAYGNQYATFAGHMIM